MAATGGRYEPRRGSASTTRFADLNDSDRPVRSPGDPRVGFPRRDRGAQRHRRRGAAPRPEPSPRRPPPMPTRRSVTALLAAAAVAVAGLTAVTASAAQAATGCKVDYRITNQWQGGFGTDVTITNLGDPISAWTVG